MSRKRQVLLGTVALASAAAVVPTGSAAWAGAPSAGRSLSAIQAKAAAAVTLRVNTLNAAIARVNADSRIGPGAPALVAYLQKDLPGLGQLGQKIAADPSASVAGVDARTIFTDYRVLVLAIPAARLAAASDQIDNTSVVKLTAASAKAATYENAGNQATVAPLLSDLNGQISSITSSTAGIASTVLGYTPAQWNTDHAVLFPSRSAMDAARVDLKKARSDLQQVRAAIRASHQSGS